MAVLPDGFIGVDKCDIIQSSFLFIVFSHLTVTARTITKGIK